MTEQTEATAPIDDDADSDDQFFQQQRDDERADAAAQLRIIALGSATAAHNGSGTPDHILDTARKFHAFLAGTEAVTAEITPLRAA